MSAAALPSPPILGGGEGGGQKISDQNNWEGPEQKIKLRGGELNFRGGSMNPNDVMVVVLKSILLC